MDAIIVPSSRSGLLLVEAGRLAVLLDATLLVLCSKYTDPRVVIEHLARMSNLRVAAVEFPKDGAPGLPVLETSTVLGRSRLQRRADTSAKRNLGLVLARMSGWRNVVFLDDDITVPDAYDLERAAALLGTHDGVGLEMGGYPDNSVVCHANRLTGDKQQDTFIGGGALAVPADRIDSFFPEIYNEDWFFLLGDAGLRPVGQIGRAWQRDYDPFLNPDRARGEEFGDVLAEGIFARLDHGLPIAVERSYWSEFLAVRLELIKGIENRIDRGTPRGEQMLKALGAAKGRLRYIQPEDCVRYLEAWRNDQKTWRDYMGGIGRNSENAVGPATVQAALRSFGLVSLTSPARDRSRTKPERAALRSRREMSVLH
ncbi:hypothetical protein [Actinoplanes regularis]|uniref:hypothetical protein n=1 Tax=Actinoplanes regularis TaxID=52697 RepID=UPI001177C8AC|nr:hypothetical protein [Actinoplanes regularis]GIE84655.1 hypothetical protein Are01nite_11350 [Actinoplanes regularis]